MAIAGPLFLILNIAFYLLFAHIILSWLISFQVLSLGQPFVAQLWQGLTRLFEPMFAPIRRILPDTRPLDLAPLVVFVIIISLRDFIVPSIFL